jgi:hypothetical protein
VYLSYGKHVFELSIVAGMRLTEDGLNELADREVVGHWTPQDDLPPLTVAANQPP